MEPKLARHLVDHLSGKIQQLLSIGQSPVILCAPQLRLAFKRFFEGTFNELTVLSYAEIPQKTEVQNVGMILSPET
jgi:flagellar biosynthesis protein FlhA